MAADIIAGELIVYGIVKGNVRGKGKIEIKKDGSVNGDLTTAQIIIEDGAYFKGSNRDREERGKRRRHKHFLSNGICTGCASGECRAKEYLIMKGCLGFCARDRDSKWLAEFGCSHFRSG